MGKPHRTYTPEFKVRLVMELISEQEKSERSQPGIWHQRYGHCALAAGIHGTSATDL